MKKDNRILIGMPGVGKSTVGVILAKILGYHFVDSDLVIQQQEQRLLKEIIEQDGIDGFLAIENQTNAGLDVSKSIIATGGSAVYGQEAMEHFKEIGQVIYLRVAFEQLEKRLGNIKNRGVVIRKGQTLRELYEERVPLYEKYADIIIDEDGQNPEETIEAILKALNNTPV